MGQPYPCTDSCVPKGECDGWPLLYGVCSDSTMQCCDTVSIKNIIVKITYLQMAGSPFVNVTQELINVTEASTTLQSAKYANKLEVTLV